MPHIVFLNIYIYLNLYLLILEREEAGRERERERETLLCCSTYLRVHWLLLVCALTRDGIYNLGLL